MTSLQGDEAPAIVALLRRFLPAYLAGQPISALSYFLAPRAQVVALGAGLEVEEVEDFAQVGDRQGSRRTALATLRVRDPETNAVLLQRYRVELVRRDRWYVRSIDGGST